MRFRVMVCRLINGETWDEEYSGIYHYTRITAEEELIAARYHTADDPTVQYCYIDYK